MFALPIAICVLDGTGQCQALVIRRALPTGHALGQVRRVFSLVGNFLAAIFSINIFCYFLKPMQNPLLLLKNTPTVLVI